jgi:hypothetical protein
VIIGPIPGMLVSRFASSPCPATLCGAFCSARGSIVLAMVHPFQQSNALAGRAQASGSPPNGGRNARLALAGTVAHPGRAHADRTDTGHDLALGQMPVANQPLLAFFGQTAGRSRKSETSASMASAKSFRAPAQNFSKRILKCEFNNIILGHAYLDASINDFCCVGWFDRFQRWFLAGERRLMRSAPPTAVMGDYARAVCLRNSNRLML